MKDYNNITVVFQKDGELYRLRGQKAQSLAQFYQMYSLGKVVHENEIFLLRLMYDDLAARWKNGQLTREVFDTFFHLNGLWGQEMFRMFDRSQEGTILFEEFIYGIEVVVKGSFEERSKVLFNFYDVDKTGGVSYKEFLKMVSKDYPKQDIRSMVTEENFLQSIENYQLSYYFGPKQTLDEKNIIEEVDEEGQGAETQIARKASQYNPSSTEFMKIQQKLLKLMETEKKNKKPSPSNSMSLKSINDQNFKKNSVSAGKKAGSMLTLPTHVKKKNLQLTTNIAFLVKKYAAYIFKQLKLDKNKDEMNEEQFNTILKNHYRIFCIYFEGFHSYIWQNDEQKHTPFYDDITPWIEDECQIHYRGEISRRYIKFIKTTLFIFNRRQDKLPMEIKNLQGLIVDEIRDKNKHGFVLRHRDGIYPEKEYYFKDQKIYKEWLRFLSQFRNNSIYNEYQLIERVGAGNFSVVFKGIYKNGNQQKEIQKKDKQKEVVAIKVIEKFKLSMNQKQVIKFECGILQLCHHPSIIRFYKQYNTKTHIYIVTQFMEEGDLFEYTKKNTFLEEYQAAVILKQLIEAIRYLNQLDLIHRDLKPENILVTTNKQKNTIQRVKIIDFGFAVYKKNLKHMDQKEKFAGTPGYVAPEIFKMQEYDESVDMFSLGIIMYFMLCGNLPFFSLIYEQIVQQTVECNLCLNNSHWMNISDNAKDLLKKILTFKDTRINSKQALDHPWLKNIEELSEMKGRNKKHRYV